MLRRLLWRIITPRQLRRVTLVALLVWLGAAYLHQDGAVERVREQLPQQVHFDINPPHLPTFAPPYGNSD